MGIREHNVEMDILDARLMPLENGSIGVELGYLRGVSTTQGE